MRTERGRNLGRARKNATRFEGGRKKMRRTLGGGEKKNFLCNKEYLMFETTSQGISKHYPHKNISHITSNKFSPAHRSQN